MTLSGLWNAFRSLLVIEPRQPVLLDKNHPDVKRMIEMARLYQLDDYEVVNETAHHYRFYFQDGSDYLIGIVGLVEIMDELKENGLFPYVSKDREQAKVISLSEFKDRLEKGLVH